jgi:hypothetical protein
MEASSGRRRKKLTKAPTLLFLLELSDHLGKTLGETVEGLGPGELDAWRAYVYLKGPLGVEREDVQAGVTRAYAAAAAGVKSPKPEDFRAWPRPDMRSLEEIRDAAIREFMAMGKARTANGNTQHR